MQPWGADVWHAAHLLHSLTAAGNCPRVSLRATLTCLCLGNAACCVAQHVLSFQLPPAAAGAHVTALYRLTEAGASGAPGGPRARGVGTPEAWSKQVYAAVQDRLRRCGLAGGVCSLIWPRRCVVCLCALFRVTPMADVSRHQPSRREPDWTPGILFTSLARAPVCVCVFSFSLYAGTSTAAPVAVQQRLQPTAAAPTLPLTTAPVLPCSRSARWRC